MIQVNSAKTVFLTVKKKFSKTKKIKKQPEKKINFS